MTPSRKTEFWKYLSDDYNYDDISAGVTRASVLKLLCIEAKKKSYASLRNVPNGAFRTNRTFGGLFTGTLDYYGKATLCW